MCEGTHTILHVLWSWSYEKLKKKKIQLGCCRGYRFKLKSWVFLLCWSFKSVRQSTQSKIDWNILSIIGINSTWLVLTWANWVQQVVVVGGDIWDHGGLWIIGYIPAIVVASSLDMEFSAHKYGLSMCLKFLT